MFKLNGKISLILIVAVLVASVFGFAGMTHTNMKNCDPISSTSDCPPSVIGMALHHIAAYGTFMQAIITSTTATMVSLILLASTLSLAFIFRKQLLLDQALSFTRFRLRNNSESFSYQLRKITRWLSLFENSPAIYARH